MAQYDPVSGDGKPDLFEMAVLELLRSYQILLGKGGFTRPEISSAIEKISEAKTILDKSV